jgi:hypothetical protein
MAMRMPPTDMQAAIIEKIKFGDIPNPPGRNELLLRVVRHIPAWRLCCAQERGNRYMKAKARYPDPQNEPAPLQAEAALAERWHLWLHPILE